MGNIFASCGLCTEGIAEDNPAHLNHSMSRSRPDACCPVCCTLPDCCSLVGIACLSEVCYFCLLPKGSKVYMNNSALGAFTKCCTPCCSLNPLVKMYTEGLKRPAAAFTAPDGSHKMLSRDEYEVELKRTNDWPEPCKNRRRADGGGMNPDMPYLGQGGRPFAIAVPNKSLALRLGDKLPDPEQIFDELFARREGTFRKCPCNANALIMYFAFVAIHEFFRTDEGAGEDGDGIERPWINGNSSFLDLQSVYGNTEQRMKEIRTMKGGKLQEGVLGDEKRFSAKDGLQTPRALLLCFQAEHNYIADQLVREYPDKFAGDDAEKEEELFQQARA
jgi:hypothetical protein